MKSINRTFLLLIICSLCIYQAKTLSSGVLEHPNQLGHSVLTGNLGFNYPYNFYSYAHPYYYQGYYYPYNAPIIQPLLIQSQRTISLGGLIGTGVGTTAILS